MNPIDDLANSFMKFPGIGRRQAKRFAYFIIQSNPSFSNKLSAELGNPVCVFPFAVFKKAGNPENLPFASE